MIRILTLIALLFPIGAWADNFPARFQVTGVAADDILNIREAPIASAGLSGGFQPYAVNIEVLRLSEDGKWGMVSTGEANGWVSMRYLAPSPPADPNTIPRPFTCSGTEPFWTLAMTVRGSEFSEIGTPRENLIDRSENAANGAYFANFDQGPYISFALMAERARCSDGMSDREFGFSARLFIETPDGNRFLRGCCTMDINR